MPPQILRLFDNQTVIEAVKAKLPEMFVIANKECSRNGKVGMEVGSLRERIIIALLIQQFGARNVVTNGITEHELDVLFFNERISIKTVSGPDLTEIKAVWTVDHESARDFIANYCPTCDILLIHINWGGTGCIYYIPLSVQQDLLNSVGRENYLKMPPENTNPRGVVIRKNIVKRLAADQNTIRKSMSWPEVNVDYDPHDKWVEMWNEVLPSEGSVRIP